MTDPDIKARLFVAAAIDAGLRLTLPSAQTHYLLGVLRLKAGDAVALFNGRDGEWLAHLGVQTRKACALDIERRLKPQRPSADLWLLFAPIKRARLDFIAEKATELGVTGLQAVFTQFTVITRVNVERLRANAIEAAEQCGRLDVPEIFAPAKLDDVLDTWPNGRRLLFCDESGASPPIVPALASENVGQNRAWAVLIGPEGGFHPDERARLRAFPGTVSVGLGPRILRADTAAIAALALWQVLIGDWRAVT
jgi:16S rRNA (uracil1498-N3)-methyltransferase